MNYPDLGSASGWLKENSLAAQPVRSTTKIWVVHVINMEFLRSLLRRRFARAQVATSRNVGCFLRLTTRLTNQNFKKMLVNGVIKRGKCVQGDKFWFERSGVSFVNKSQSVVKQSQGRRELLLTLECKPLYTRVRKTSNYHNLWLSDGQDRNGCHGSQYLKTKINQLFRLLLACSPCGSVRSNRITWPNMDSLSNQVQKICLHNPCNMPNVYSLGNFLKKA